jgi:CubicO group peptidase (beta-lactamase class C family)
VGNRTIRETAEPSEKSRGQVTSTGSHPTRRRRQWLRRTLFIVASAVGTLILMVLAVYGWAWSSTDGSSIARAMIWTEADVGDQFRFPSRPIPAGDDPSRLPAGAAVDLPAPSAGGDLEAFLRRTDTLAFLVVHGDRVVYERYTDGSERRTLQTSFSVAKSFLSALVGIAIDEGSISSIDDSVTDYVPELADRDPRFERITLRHLLSMSSGLRYVEQSAPLPWGDDIDTYYGTDLRDLALNATEIVEPPGRDWLYNNYNPLLLGLVLERATGTSVSDYMATRLWQPLGAEHDATWSLDSKASGFEKMESGLNVAPVDYARFGPLFLHGGEWNGNRIVSENWVRSATDADATTDPSGFYQHFWWIDSERPERFYSLGNFGQYIYVAPDAEAVIVRSGSDWGIGNDEWLTTFRDMADRLAETP